MKQLIPFKKNFFYLYACLAVCVLGVSGGLRTPSGSQFSPFTVWN